MVGCAPSGKRTRHVPARHDEAQTAPTAKTSAPHTA